MKYAINKLDEFIKLPAGKQVIYMFSLMVIIMGSITLYFYKKREGDFKKLELKNEAQVIIIERLTDKIDSLHGNIYMIKLEYLEKQLNKSDSLLAESEQLKRSMNPLLKTVNKKLNHIQNEHNN